MADLYNTRIRPHLVELQKHVNPMGLLPHLDLRTTDRQLVVAQNTQSGPSQAWIHLHDAMERESDIIYNRLLRGLREMGHNDLADKIEGLPPREQNQPSLRVVIPPPPHRSFSSSNGQSPSTASASIINITTHAGVNVMSGDHNTQNVLLETGPEVPNGTFDDEDDEEDGSDAAVVIEHRVEEDQESPEGGPPQSASPASIVIYSHEIVEEEGAVPSTPKAAGTSLLDTGSHVNAEEEGAVSMPSRGAAKTEASDEEETKCHEVRQTGIASDNTVPKGPASVSSGVRLGHTQRDETRQTLGIDLRDNVHDENDRHDEDDEEMELKQFCPDVTLTTERNDELREIAQHTLNDNPLREDDLVDDNLNDDLDLTEAETVDPETRSGATLGNNNTGISTTNQALLGVVACAVAVLGVLIVVKWVNRKP